MTDATVKQIPSWWGKKCAVCGFCAIDNYGGVSMNYMVSNDVWKAAGLLTGDYAHVQCLERKLGRPLVIDDFPDLVINNVIRWALAKT